VPPNSSTNGIVSAKSGLLAQAAEQSSIQAGAMNFRTSMVSTALFVTT
jgi:hypothetical protein